MASEEAAAKKSSSSGGGAGFEEDALMVILVDGNYIIHRIHKRILQHIAIEAEHP